MLYICLLKLAMFIAMVSFTKMCVGLGGLTSFMIVNTE